MNILIFGATGKTGRKLIELALAKGHTATAFVRDSKKLDNKHENLHIVEGDILDQGSIEGAFAQPVDAVVSALGIFHREPKTELSDGTRNIIEVMNQKGVRRIAVVSTIGAGETRGQGNFIARNLQRLFLPHVIDDKNRQEAHLMNSELDWTIVRPPQLTDSAEIRTDLITWQGPTPTQPKLSWKTSRATVAGFLLDEIEKNNYIKQAINISAPK